MEKTQEEKLADALEKVATLGAPIKKLADAVDKLTEAIGKASAERERAGVFTTKTTQ